VLGRTQSDELNRGFAKLNVAFTLPPGSYATLVVKRLFHRTAREDTPDEIRATPGSGRPALEEPEASARFDLGPRPPRTLEPGKTRSLRPGSGPPEAAGGLEPGKTRSLRPGSDGFRARAKARKEAKAAARARQKLR